MKSLHLPYISLPFELIQILKTNLSINNPSLAIADIIRKSPSLSVILQRPFQEFNLGLDMERSIASMGWQNFRDRLAGIYIHKSLFGAYPSRPTIDEVLDIKNLEDIFSDHYVRGPSRVFMLGFYLRLLNIHSRNHLGNDANEIKIPQDVISIIKNSKSKSLKIDWLILILMHLSHGIGHHELLQEMNKGKKVKELYFLLNKDQRKLMIDNLLAYGSSIGESDLFLYDKI